MKTSNYYNLSFQEVKDGLVIYQDDLKGMESEQLLKGIFIDNWPPDMKLYVEGKIPTDNLFYPLSPTLVISKKVKSALIASSIKGIQFLPVRVIHKSEIQIPDYFLLNILNVITALNYEKTVWMTPEKENVQHPQLNIWEAALRKEAILDFDIFRIIELQTQIFVSELFRKCLEEHKAILGFNFITTPVY